MPQRPGPPALDPDQRRQARTGPARRGQSHSRRHQRRLRRPGPPALGPGSGPPAAGGAAPEPPTLWDAGPPAGLPATHRRPPDRARWVQVVRPWGAPPNGPVTVAGETPSLHPSMSSSEARPAAPAIALFELRSLDPSRSKLCVQTGRAGDRHHQAGGEDDRRESRAGTASCYTGSLRALPQERESRPAWRSRDG